LHAEERIEEAQIAELLRLHDPDRFEIGTLEVQPVRRPSA
jgi:hypothetical protein